MKLSNYEKETIILFSEADKEANIQTFNTKLRNKLARFGEKYPELCRLEATYDQGGVSYVVDRSFMSIIFRAPLTEEQRQRMREQGNRLQEWRFKKQKGIGEGGEG